jgi:NAD(P)-dependent dehydrogenase (short-subunit alcohol dehydrogenase family)
MDGIDISAANAGLAYWECIREPDCGRIEAIIQTNLLSPVQTAEKMRALFPEAGNRVVITSPILGPLGLDGYAL